MTKHVRFIRVSLVMVAVLVAALGMVALTACSQQSSGSSSASGASSASASSVASTSVSSAASSSSVATAGGEDIVTIGLDNNAGTGYQWQCKMEPEGIVSLVDQGTEDLSESKQMTGGPLRESFTFRAAKPGEVVITFDLKRNGEDGAAKTQVYAFTVSNDLKMVLNPYKSDFDNEPEWGSNS